MCPTTGTRSSMRQRRRGCPDVCRGNRTWTFDSEAVSWKKTELPPDDLGNHPSHAGEHLLTGELYRRVSRTAAEIPKHRGTKKNADGVFGHW